VRLFVRSTRSVCLTDGGKAYFEQCRGALNQLLEAERQVTGDQVQPSGTLRISAPTTYAHHRLLPLLPAFRAKFPLIKVEVHISNRNVDLHNENFDCAVRVRPQPDSTTTVARLLENALLVTVASPPTSSDTARRRISSICRATNASSSTCRVPAGRLDGYSAKTAQRKRSSSLATIRAPKTSLAV